MPCGKKVKNGGPCLVLPERTGRVVVREDAPLAAVRDAIPSRSSDA
jgi:hypothetical protein